MIAWLLLLSAAAALGYVAGRVHEGVRAGGTLDLVDRLSVSSPSACVGPNVRLVNSPPSADVKAIVIDAIDAMRDQGRWRR